MEFKELRRSGILALLVSLSLAAGAGGAVAKGSKCKKPAKCKDVVQTLSSTGQHKQLTAAIKSAGLEKTLKGKGPFTVLAPTDSAFAKSKARVEAAKGDNKKLAEMLKYHVIPKKVSAADFKSRASIQTVQGEHVMTQVKGEEIWVDGAKVIQYDVPAGNGMIFFIDEVLAPERGK